MKYTLTDEQYGLLLQLVVRPLQAAGAEVYIFGSRATGHHHPFSDIDLLYIFPEGKFIAKANLREIKQGIEDSHFPFSVDLVNWDDLVDSYRPSVLKQRIQLN
jgi:predicted nucleotidyltransferase